MIKLPDTPTERVNIGSAVSFAALKTAIEQLVGANGLPMVIEVTEVKPAGFLKDSIEGLVITHATEPRKYSKAVLTQDVTGVAARLMVYYVGTDKYTRNMRAAEITQRNHAITSGITRMLNASKAQQQEMYYEDMGVVVMEAIDMVQRGDVRPPASAPAPSPQPAPRPQPAPQPRSTPASAPQPAPRPAPAPAPQSVSRPQHEPSTQPEPQPAPAPAPQPEPAPAPRPAPAPETVSRAQQRRDSAPLPQLMGIPMSEVEGPRVSAVCTCPHCGIKVRVTVPNANCQVNITCGRCHQKFPVEVRRRS